MNEKYFSEDYLKTDLGKGVISNKNGTRFISLTEDFLIGFRNALTEETGEANKVVFKSCGKLWGKNFIERFNNDFQKITGNNINELTINEFDNILKEFWVTHGWGEIEINWENGYNTGIFSINIKNPAFSSIFKDENNFSDEMFSGILSSFFSYYSGKEIECIQTEYESTPTFSKSSFVAGIEERLEKVEDLVLSKKSHNEIINKLINVNV